MSNPNLEDTAPNRPLEDTSPTRIDPGPGKKLKTRRWLWILLGLVLVIVGVAAGSLIGYNDGKAEIDAAKNRQKMIEATSQFQLAMEDQKSGNYETALKRLQHIINNLDPKFPGAQEKLVEVMLAMSSTATLPPAPTASPTPAFTPTPDMRGEQELLNAAHQALVDKDWNRAIQTLDNLRKLNIGYQPIAVDGMYYVALRNRGMDKIRKGQLEEGMYDMSLTERFGPLDKDANGYRNWARLYVTGSSFWKVDWVQVINYFSQLYAAVPALTDGSGMSVAQRYREALVSYAQDLEKDEQYCDAEQQYALALQVNADKELGKQATAVYKKCHPPTATAEPTEAIPTEETPVLPPDITPETPVDPDLPPTETPTPTPNSGG